MIWTDFSFLAIFRSTNLMILDLTDLMILDLTVLDFQFSPLRDLKGSRSSKSLSSIDSRSADFFR